MKIITLTIIVLGILTPATAKDAGFLSEPVTMIALGAGLIGLAGIGRRILIEKS